MIWSLMYRILAGSVKQARIIVSKGKFDSARLLIELGRGVVVSRLECKSTKNQARGEQCDTAGPANDV